MSQHIFKTQMPDGLHVEVIIGYDRPLDYVFCTVFDPGDYVIYSNLNDDNAGCTQQDVEYYRPILTALGITVPEGMYIETKADQSAKIGNRVIHYSPGSVEGKP